MLDLAWFSGSYSWLSGNSFELFVLVLVDVVVNIGDVLFVLIHFIL